MRVRFHPSISATIFGAFVAMGLLTAAVGGYGLFVLQRAGGFVVDLYDRPLMAINFDRAASLDFVEMDKELIRRTIAGEEERREIDTRIETLAKNFKEDLAVAAARSRYDDEKAVIAEIGELVGRWNELRLGGVSRATGGDLDRLTGRIIERFDALAELATDHSFVERRKVVRSIGFFKLSGFAALAAALALSVGITAVLLRRIIKPLRGAAAIADRIAAGELETPIPDGGHDETGALLRSMSVMQENIREMVERETVQRRSAQNRLAEALENSHEAIILVDATGSIVIANSQLADFFPDAGTCVINGASFGDAFAGIEPLLDAAAAPGDANAAELRPVEREFPLADGRWVRISRSRTEEGGFFLVISDFSDIKEREQRLNEARREAEAASAAKSSFLANMSHELRTPLNAIIGFSEIMASELFGRLGNDNYVGYVRDIQQSGSHLLDVINSVLDLSKSEAGKLDLACESFAVTEIIESSVAIIREQCARAGLVLETHVPDPSIQVWGDAAKLRQVLLNLLSNAVKFSEPGGSVSIAATRAAGGSLTIEVADTGIGMSANEIPTAFAPFGQVDSRLSRRYEGTGLGLPLSKAIVELHGGTIAVDSTPGKGTTVIVTLPPPVAATAVAA